MLLDEHFDELVVSVLAREMQRRQAELRLGVDERLVHEQQIGHLLVSVLRR